jgi:hypothetical protein
MRVILFALIGLSILCASCSTSSPESVAKRVEELSLQRARIEQLAIRSPHSSPDVLSSIQAGRVAWTNYLNAEKEQRTIFAVNGIVLDGKYYRLQEQLLESFSRQWQQIEDLLAQAPSVGRLPA